MILNLIFYAFAAVAIIAATAVITLRDSVRSVLSLVVTFFAMAGIWMMARAEFLSLVLLLVYVGAVMTLFLFVVMMLNVKKEEDKPSFVRYLPFGIFIILLTMALVFIGIGPERFGLAAIPAPALLPADYSNTTQLGMVLFTNYVYPFEIAGVVLLAAIIAAITLAHRQPRKRKVQNVSAQIAVQPKDRLRLIKMPSEKKV